MAMHHSAVNTLPPMELCTPAVQSCKAPWWLVPYISQRLCTPSGKSRSALYTRCTTRNDPQSVHCRVLDYHEHDSESHMELYRSIAMELYRSVQHVYENSIDGRVFTAEIWITMSVILNCTPSEQGATGLPRMRTQPVGDVRGQPPCGFTAPHSGSIKVPMAAECTPPSGALA